MLGYVGDRDPETVGISRKKASKPIDELVVDLHRHIADRVVPALRDAVAKQLGTPDGDAWSLGVDQGDASTVNFRYPAAFAAGAYADMAYITPRVKLELGARGDPWPTERKGIRPYAAFLKTADTTVTVLSARRTFWEKATALHAEAHRPPESTTPANFSRHYADLGMLLETDEGRAAADYALLAEVVKHKSLFFRSAWSNYGSARPGKFRLVPDAAHLKMLRADYRAMAPMIFDERPLPFDAIMARLAEAQDKINGVSGTGRSAL